MGNFHKDNVDCRECSDQEHCNSQGNVNAQMCGSSFAARLLGNCRKHLSIGNIQKETVDDWEFSDREV